MPPLWTSTIEDFRVEPEKAVYSPGESVRFSGFLEVWKWRHAEHPEGRPIEIWSDMVKTEFSGVTGHEGTFEIVAVLPTEPDIYTYRAHFPGHDFWAQEDSSWSNPITLSTEIPAPPPPPPPPPPPRFSKYILYASLGLMGVGTLMWLAKKR